MPASVIGSGGLPIPVAWCAALLEEEGVALLLQEGRTPSNGIGKRPEPIAEAGVYVEAASAGATEVQPSSVTASSNVDLASAKAWTAVRASSYDRSVKASMAACSPGRVRRARNFRLVRRRPLGSPRGRASSRAANQSSPSTSKRS